MPRLIDADTIFNGELLVVNTEAYDAVRAIIEKINNAPTVDAEPVVRCKDCKHYIADGCDECELMSAKSIIASINNKRWHSDFYCAWGERREGTDD